jgi:HD-GYP domain-containing protein (c-di-GMP phosphodiesterase class II)
VPVHIVEKVSRGEFLSESESRAYQQHSELGFKLLRNIPRLETVADSIRYQSQHFDGTGFPGDGVEGEALPLGARILHAVLSLDLALVQKAEPLEALRTLKDERAHFDPKVLNVLEPLVVRDCGLDVFQVRAADLSEGMYLAADVVSTTGLLLVAKGQQVTAPLRMKLISMNSTLREPLSVHYLQDSLLNVG